MQNAKNFVLNDYNSFDGEYSFCGTLLAKVADAGALYRTHDGEYVFHDGERVDLFKEEDLLHFFCNSFGGARLLEQAGFSRDNLPLTYFAVAHYSETDFYGEKTQGGDDYIEICTYIPDDYENRGTNIDVIGSYSSYDDAVDAIETMFDGVRSCESRMCEYYSSANDADIDAVFIAGQYTKLDEQETIEFAHDSESDVRANMTDAEIESLVDAYEDAARCSEHGYTLDTDALFNHFCDIRAGLAAA